MTVTGLDLDDDDPGTMSYPALMGLLDGLEDAVAAIEAFIPMNHADDNIEALLSLHHLITGMNWANGRLTAADRELEAIIADRLGDNATLPAPGDDKVWVAKPETKYTGLDRAGMRSAVNRWATEPRLDKETGELVEPTIAEVLDRVWEVADVADGRTRKLRDGPGIWLDDYADRVDTTTRVKAVNATTIRPDKRESTDE